ncbi:MAG TPA: hypothetical protein VNP36_10760 [Burkholderiales bacterium]|nr:hypothetical protein [Burkholderiales bacterium]
MNVKTLRPFVAALVLASLAHSAIAETLGEHPAVIVARTWSNRGIDPNTFVVLHPAAPQFLAASPTEIDRVTREQASSAANAVSAPKPTMR